MFKILTKLKNKLRLRYRYRQAGAVMSEGSYKACRKHQYYALFGGPLLVIAGIADFILNNYHFTAMSLSFPPLGLIFLAQYPIMRALIYGYENKDKIDPGIAANTPIDIQRGLKIRPRLVFLALALSGLLTQYCSS